MLICTVSRPYFSRTAKLGFLALQSGETALLDIDDDGQVQIECQRALALVGSGQAYMHQGLTVEEP
jgi:hypothetical protein